MGVRIALLVACLLLGAARVDAEPRVELVTVGPGDAIWTRWGHVVLRVVDPATGRDDAYDFGAGPFDEPAFAWDFVRGRARFHVVRTSWARRRRSFAAQDRRVERRVLDLTRDEARRLTERLEDHVRPENRSYRYDHWRDNCATRVRDLLDEVSGGALRRAAGTGALDVSYREQALAGAVGILHAQLAIDLLNGPEVDAPVVGWGSLYLPRELDAAIARARRPGGGALAGAPVRVHERRGPPPLRGDPRAARHLLLAAGALVFGFGALARLRRPPLARAAGVAAAGLALVSGLLGAVLWLLLAVSEVPELAWSENALALWPWDLAALPAALRLARSGRPSAGRRLRLYLDARLALLAAAVAAKAAGLLVQDSVPFLLAAALGIAGLRLALVAPGPRSLS